MVRKGALALLAASALAVTPLSAAQAATPKGKLPKLVTLAAVRQHQLNL
jgi:hypothetical protein